MGDVPAMRSAIRQYTKERVPPRLRSRLRDIYGAGRWNYYPHKSWSQTGEDMLVRDLLAHRGVGSFVDVGAFHPRFGSNTYGLYRRGWSGVNIDARPGSMEAFRRSRSRDQNLEVAIGTDVDQADFYVFYEDELCSLDVAWAERQISLGHRLDRVVRTRVATLSDIHRECAVPARYELLSVDCEGRDADVLASNDWTAYRPQVIVVECSTGDLDSGLRSPAVMLLRDAGYQPTAATRLSIVLKDAR
jgi:FkbM family methyltransferase